MLRLIGLILTFVVLHPSVTQASIVNSARTEAELLSEVNSIQPDASFWVALRLKPDSGWHTYWRNPGDSGIPTHIKWDIPADFEVGEIEWPYPETIAFPPLVTYGYHGEVFLLTRIHAPPDLEPGSTVTLKAKARWLACEKICIPGQGDFRLDLPVSTDVAKGAAGWIEAFAETRSRLPLKEGLWEWEVSANHKAVRLDLLFNGTETYSPGEIVFYPYEDDLIDHAAEQKLEETPAGYRLWIKRSGLRDGLPKVLSGVLVSEHGWRGKGSEKAVVVDTVIDLLDESVGMPFEAQGMPLLLALLFAFAGGMLLNLMPCVLPVLSIKILNFVEQAEENKQRPGIHGLVFTAGVMISFWILAGLLIALRAGGSQIGWGFQLQAPGFVAFLAALFFLLALSLFGVYEIGTSLTGLGGNLTGKSGLRDSFLGGVLATVVATPCSAPFMGAALGFALAQSALVALAVFTALGFGMAFPYLILSTFPKLLAFVPKPGAWMIRFKQAMGVLFLATTLWLLWVFLIQKGMTATLLLVEALGCFGAGILFEQHRRMGHIKAPEDSLLKRLIRFLPASVFVTAFIFLLGAILMTSAFLVEGRAGTVLSDSAGQTGGIKWQAYSDDVLQASLQAGEPVFIDFTAAWCLSCKVNERVAFHSGRVRERFEELGVKALIADWTSRDETITRALARYGRNSVPLYVYYAKGQTEPVILPEILTPGIVLDALE